MQLRLVFQISLVLCQIAVASGVSFQNNNSPKMTSYTTTNTLAVATVSKTIIEENLNRKGMIIYNNSSNTIYLSLNCPAIASSNMFAPVAAFQSYSFPLVNYTGRICGIRNAGTGNVIVNEFYN